jgi:hypothetical protein
MMTHASVASIIRSDARERERTERLMEALRAISRKRIMDGVNAINMRAIALAAIAVDSRHERV